MIRTAKPASWSPGFRAWIPRCVAGWSRRTIRGSVTALRGFQHFEQRLCIMLPYRVPRESADSVIRLNLGSIRPCSETVTEGTLPPPALLRWKEELHDR